MKQSVTDYISVCCFSTYSNFTFAFILGVGFVNAALMVNNIGSTFR